MKTLYTIQDFISKHSDYESEMPHWINLQRDIEDKEVLHLMAKLMNDFFKKYGPDACDDFTSSETPLLQHSTAIKALKYAIQKGGKKCALVDINSLIDGGWSTESDGRVNDPVTGRLLHELPINEDSTVDELIALLDGKWLSKDDWVFVDYCYNSFGENGSQKVIRLIRDIVIKFYGKKMI